MTSSLFLTPLLFPIVGPFPTLFKEIKQAKKLLLLREGADPNITCVSGQTVLASAIFEGSWEIVRLLREASARE